MDAGRIVSVFALATLIASATACSPSQTDGNTVKLLNVSYDPTREFYKEFNVLFAEDYKKKTGKNIEIDQSHGGSGKQARAVIDGLEGDVVTLALGFDIDAIAERGLMTTDWAAKLPHNSTPYTSTIVLLVRKGNPKAIKDWDDLAKSGVAVITPNPKTSGGARWNYLAAWGFGRKKLGSEDKARDLVGALFKNVPKLDTGARASATTFAKNEIGDVLLAWENEALLTLKEFPDRFEIVYPSISIVAEPPVAVVDKVAARRGTADVAKAYLEFLYTEPVQELIATHGFRPRSEAALKKAGDKFPKIELLTIADFGGWAKAQKEHFSDDGIFDKLMAKR